MEEDEALETSTIISELTHAIKDEIRDFTTNGGITTRIDGSGIFFTRKQLLWVIDLTISTSTDFINNGGFKVHIDSTWDMLASTSLREEGIEGIFSDTNGLVRRHLTVLLDTMLKAIKFPARITYANTGLTDMEANDLSHFCNLERNRFCEHI